MTTLFYAFLLLYILYGIVHIKRNPNLQRFEKLIWIIFVICMPGLGASIYLRSTFVECHGKW